MEESLVGVGFCLSEEGDLLSQWRGYAADASGVVIGFSRNYLDWLCSSNLPDELGGLNLHKVDYAASAHDSRVAPTSDFLIRMRKQAK